MIEMVCSTFSTVGNRSKLNDGTMACYSNVFRGLRSHKAASQISLNSLEALYFLSHLHSLQVENCDSNSRLVVNEYDNG